MIKNTNLEDTKRINKKKPAKNIEKENRYKNSESKIKRRRRLKKKMNKS